MSYFSTLSGFSPAGYWRLGETSGTTAADASGNARPGTYVASPTLGVASSMASDADTAVTFNGTSQQVSIPDDAAFRPGTAGFSLVFNYKSTASGTNVAFGKWQGTGASYWAGLNSGKLTFSIGDGTTTSTLADTTNSNDGNWHHCVAVRRGTAHELYRDGTLVASATISSGLSIAPTDILSIARFGNGGGGAAFWFNGSLDEAAYVPSGLTSGNATSLYTAWSASGVTPTMSADLSAIDPHTSGIVVTLTGVATAWTGGTTFTVSGVSGVTKTAQSVASGTSATVTLTTGTTAGTLTISDGTRSTTVTVVDRKTRLVTTGGVDITVIEPAAYSGTSPAGVVLYHGGNGETRTAWTSDALKAGIREQLLADGRVLVAVSSGTTHWGNDAAMACYAAARAWVDANLNVAGVVLLPQSMGGLTAFRAAADPATYGTIKGVYAIYPCCSPLAEYDDVNTFDAQILSAWGAADRAALVAALSGKDPLTRPASAYPNRRYRFRHSSGDTVVLKSSNTDAMRTLLGGTTTVANTLVTTTGDHGDASNFDAADASAFVTAALADVPGPTAGTLSESSHTSTTVTLAWGAGSGTGTVTSQLQRSPSGAGTWANVSGATSSPYTDTGLSAGTAYDYRVVYTDSNGSANSNTVTTTTTAAPTVAPSVASQTSTTATLNANAARALTYAWAAVSGASYSNNAVANPVVTYAHAGTYTHSITVTDADGLTATGSVSVTISQAATVVTVSPSSAIGARQFTASATDQFGNAMIVTPTWSVQTVAATVDASGNFVPATNKVRATVGSVYGEATILNGGGVSALLLING